MPAPGDLVHETSVTTGTGNFTVAAVNGHRRFSTVFGTGGANVFDYFIANQSAAEWERGTGSMSAASTLVRDTVIASSNADAAVNFSAGTKDVTNDIPAANQARIDAANAWTALNTFSQYSADDVDNELTLRKSRNATVGSHTVVNSGDDIGSIRFQGSDGTNFETAALILCEVGHDAGNDDMPGRLTFYTTPNGSATPTERLRIDHEGHIIVGGTANIGKAVEINRTDDHAALSCARWENNNASFDINFNKSRGTTVGSFTVVQEGDSLGSFSFYGSDGDQFVLAARFRANVDGGPGNNDMPGAMMLETTADGASDVTERFRVGANGHCGIGTQATGSRRLHVQDETSDTNTVTYIQRLQHKSTGSPAIGIGLGMEFVAETAADNHETIATIETVTTNVTSTTEAADLVLKTMNAGAAPVERARFISTGAVQLGTGALPTPVVRSLEFDADCLYGCTDAGNRGYIPIRHFIRCDSARTLPNDTNLNAIFNSPANGRITLETGTYLFESLILVTAMSATSGNAFINILGAGTATVAAWLWRQSSIDAVAAGTLLDDDVQFMTGNVSAVTTATTGTVFRIYIKGTFEVTVAGTLIPSIDQVTGAAASVDIGSYFVCERVGSPTVASVGQWD